MSHSFKPLNHEPVYARVAAAIEEDILSGKLKPGAQLPTEAALCDQFGVTRSSVREGIRLLQQSGLVERGAAKRLIVKNPDTTEIAEAASRSLRLGGATFREVFETSLVLYPHAAAIAAERFDTDAFMAIAEAHGGMCAAEAQNTDEIVDSAVEFFQSLAGGLDNRVMLSMLQSVNLLIGESLRLVADGAPNAHDRIVEAQRKIVDALKIGDAEEAESWMKKHIEDLMRGFQVAGVDLDARIV